MAAALREHIEEFLASAICRANPDYELVPFDRLPAGQQAVFADMQERPDFYGILKPREGSGLTIKAVSRDTALLFLTLRDAGTLPRYARPTTPEQTLSVVRLVLDQIVQLQQDGRFASGADAYSLLYQPPVEPPSDDRSQQVSVAALKGGLIITLNDPLIVCAS